MSPTMLATAARVLYRLLERNGLEPDAVFLDCGLDPLKLRDPRARYPIANIRAAWRAADAHIAKPCWGLEGGALWRPTDFHALGYAFLASRTLQSALKRIARYHVVVAQDICIEIEKTDTAFAFTYGTAAGATEEVASLQDSRCSVILRMCRDVYGPDLRLLEAALAHGWRSCSYESHFGCPVRYDAPRCGLTFPRKSVERPLPAENRALAQQNDKILQEFVRCLSEVSMTARVRRVVIDELPSGKPSAQQVAHALALTSRTLQRKLQHEDTNFEEVIEGVRKELAQQYMRSGEYDLLELTYLMGFCNLPAFSRAYKTWTGRSPSEDLPKG